MKAIEKMITFYRYIRRYKCESRFKRKFSLNGHFLLHIKYICTHVLLLTVYFDINESFKLYLSTTSHYGV